MKNKESIEELKNLDPELEVRAWANGKTFAIFGAKVVDGEEGRYITLISPQPKGNVDE